MDESTNWVPVEATAELLARVRFDERGLVPAIAQDADSGLWGTC